MLLGARRRTAGILSIPAPPAVPSEYDPLRADGADRLTSVTDPLDQVTSFTYDKNGNRLSQTDANLHTTSFEYDELDRRTALERHDTTREAFEYDENGNPTLQTDALNQTIARAYDALNRETLRTYSLPAVLTGDDIQTIATTYDPNGNPTTITETYTGTTGTRVTTRSYDNFDRLTQVTDAFGEPITYGYDPNGNRTQLTDPDGRVTLYAFDDLNRPTSVTMSGVGVTEYEYFKDDRLKELRYPSGAEARYTYDDASRVETITNLQNTAPVSSFSYGYDDNGNRIEQIETRGGPPETTTYTYDLADRLLTVSYPDQDVVYTYDDVGNRATEVATDSATSTVVVDRTLGYDTRDRRHRRREAPSVSGPGERPHPFRATVSGNFQAARREAPSVSGSSVAVPGKSPISSHVSHKRNGQ